MRCESISLIVCSTRSPSRPSVKQAARRSNRLIFRSVCRSSSAPPSLDTRLAVEGRSTRREKWAANENRILDTLCEQRPLLPCGSGYVSTTQLCLRNGGLLPHVLP